MFCIHGGAIGLMNETPRGLPARLEFGPVDIVKWGGERGWSLRG